jgi:hypothetical protein
MKTIFILPFLFVSLVSIGQNVTVPAKEFAVNLSENSVSIKPGETHQVTVTLLKSKSFSKDKATMGFSNSLPQGITVQYDQSEGKFDAAVATITVGSTVSAGTYQLILSGTMNYKTKGSILKLNVGSENVASK